MRFPVSRLMMCRRIRLDVLVAVYMVTAHETSESFRYPFQIGRGAMVRARAVGTRRMGTRQRQAGFPLRCRIKGLDQMMAQPPLSLICASASLWCKAR